MKEWVGALLASGTTFARETTPVIAARIDAQVTKTP